MIERASIPVTALDSRGLGSERTAQPHPLAHLYSSVCNNTLRYGMGGFTAMISPDWLDLFIGLVLFFIVAILPVMEGN